MERTEFKGLHVSLKSRVMNSEATYGKSDINCRIKLDSVTPLNHEEDCKYLKMHNIYSV